MSLKLDYSILFSGSSAIKKALLHNAQLRPDKAYSEHASSAQKTNEHYLLCSSEFQNLSVSVGPLKVQYLRYLIVNRALCDVHQVDKKKPTEAEVQN